MNLLLEPFGYTYMVNAIWCSALVGAICAFLSAYLMLKGWSLIGDALSHSVVPGVAGAYMLGIPYSLGAFISGGLAAAAMLFITQRSQLRTDAVIGLIFTGFFGLGLFMASLSPTSVDIQTIVFGNILAITPFDALQLVIIGLITLVCLLVFWKLPKNQQTDEGDEANDDQLEGVERCDRENIAKHDGLYIDRCW